MKPADPITYPDEVLKATRDKAAGFCIADAHTHIYPDKIARKAALNTAAFYEVDSAVEEATYEMLESQGSKIGCRDFLCCSVATAPHQVESITRFIASICEQHGNVVGLGAYHQGIEDPSSALDLVEELGLPGIKLHPDIQRFYLDDDKMIPVYKELAARGLKVLFHIGDPRMDFSALSRLENVVGQVPDLKVQAAHFGGVCCWEKAFKIDSDLVYYDISSSLGWMTRDKALELVEMFGIDRLMWGTDFPMWDHAIELTRLFELGLSDNEYQEILYGNFADFWLKG